MTIPGIGPITAHALINTVGDIGRFASSCDLPAWIGLTAKSHSSGGKKKLGHISKQGDRYLRRLFVQGASSLIRVLSPQSCPWRPGSGRFWPDGPQRSLPSHSPTSWPGSHGPFWRGTRTSTTIIAWHSSQPDFEHYRSASSKLMICKGSEGVMTTGRTGDCNSQHLSRVTRTRGNDLGRNPQTSSRPGKNFRSKAVHMSSSNRPHHPTKPLQRRSRPHTTSLVQVQQTRFYDST